MFAVGETMASPLIYSAVRTECLSSARPAAFAGRTDKSKKLAHRVRARVILDKLDKGEGQSL